MAALLEASPNLTTIKIHGDIEHRYSYYDRFDGTPGQLLKVSSRQKLVSKVTC